MGEPSDSVILNDTDLELSVVGMLMANPATLAELGPDIDARWFSDAGYPRYLFEAMAAAAADGNLAISEAVKTCLPEDVGGIPRGQFVTQLIMNAPLANRGLVGLLKDRWARRTIIAEGEALQANGRRFSLSPFAEAQAAIATLDDIVAAAQPRRTITLGEATGDFADALDKGEGVAGASTGLAVLDAKVNGFVPGQYYVIAARPGMGKSAMACSCFRRTAESGAGVAFFSLEMPAHEIVARSISDCFDDLAAPDYGDILKGNISDPARRRVREYADYFAKLPYWIDDSPSPTVGEIAARARKVKARFEAEGRRLAVLGVDHIGLIKASNRYAGNKVAETGEASNALRALAKELDCCVVALCQLNRDVEKREDKRPGLADLRWAGDIEQDAHVVMFLYREHYYLQNDPDADPARLSQTRHMLEAIIGKNRNGPQLIAELWTSIRHSSIRDAYV